MRFDENQPARCVRAPASLFMLFLSATLALNRCVVPSE